MASGDTLVSFDPLHNEPPNTNYAAFSTRNSGGNCKHPILVFPDAVALDAVFAAVLPRNYGGGGLTVYLLWAAASGFAGNVKWNAQFDRISDTAGSLDDNEATAFAAAQTTTTTTAGTNGLLVRTAIAFTSGAQMDSIAAGDGFRLRVTRDGANAADTMTVDAHLRFVEIKET